MSKGMTSKTRLLLGASTLLLTSTAGMAQSADVGIGNIITANSDSAQTQDQSNNNDVTARSTTPTATIIAGDTENGSLTLDAAKLAAAAVGNNGALSMVDADSAANATSAALGTLQAGAKDGELAISVEAVNTDSAALLTVTDITDSTASLTNSTAAATATGNSSTQSLALDSTTLSLSTGNAAAQTDLVDNAVIAGGGAVVASLQKNIGSETTATLSDSTIALTADDAISSALNVTGNAQDATAIGSTASNALALSGTTVGTGAVIASVQSSDADSAVTAGSEATVSLNADSLTSGTSATLSGNRVQARAVTASATNNLSLDATSVALDAADDSDTAQVQGSGGLINGAFVTLNSQSVANTTTATAAAESFLDPEDGLIAAEFTASVNIGGNVTGGSTIANDANMMSARAQAAVATNSTTLAIGGTLSSPEPSDSAVANAASIANYQDVADDADVRALTTTLGDGGTFGTNITGLLDDSAVSTSSNRAQAIAEATNATNTLTVSATTLSAAAGSDIYPEGYTSGGNATANSAFAVVSEQNTGNATIEAELVESLILTDVAGNVLDSSIDANGNVLEAFGSANKASNTVALSGTTVATDATAVNFQTSNAQVSANIGDESSAGVIAALGSDIINSDVSVNANLVRGSAIGNSGTNSVSASATTLNGGGTDAKGKAIGTSAQGDFSLANTQVLQGDSASSSFVGAEFGVRQAFGNELSDSRISVSSNTQFSEALGNTSTNRLAVSATSAAAGTDPTAVLNNDQTGDVNIDSVSLSWISANAASEGSSIVLNNNSNTSLGVANNAVNMVSASALTLGGSATVGSSTNAPVVTADYALRSEQDASGTVDSYADSYVTNNEAVGLNAAGTTASNVSLSGNATTAEGSANRVSNQLTVSANDAGATAMIGNAQDSSASVVAGTFNNVRYVMNTANTLEAADASSIVMQGNSTTTLARGNSASNALNYAVGATYSAPGTDAVATGTASIAATAGVLNNQSNSGPVNAFTYANYGVALNSGSGTSALNSNVTMANNSAAATAYGNVASNSLSMLTFGAGVPSSAVSSNQVNTGPVTATATSVSFGMTVGNSTGSAVRSTGNNTTATAVGNNSVNTINGGN